MVTPNSKKYRPDVAIIEPFDIHKAMISAYNTGYNAGHKDTLDGSYVYVLPVDIGTYQTDVVKEWMDDYFSVRWEE